MRIISLALPALALSGFAGCMTVTPDPPEVAACKFAVASESTGGGTTLVSVEPVIDGKAVMVRDDSSGTVWRCITDNAGAIESVDIAS